MNSSQQVNELMNKREALLIKKEKVISTLNEIIDELDVVNNEIVNNDWIKDSKISWWLWKPGIGFPHPKNERQKRKMDKKLSLKKPAETITSRLDELILIVNKEGSLPELPIEPFTTPSKAYKPVIFTVYPDIMEDKAYGKIN